MDLGIKGRVALVTGAPPVRSQVWNVCEPQEAPCRMFRSPS